MGDMGNSVCPPGVKKPTGAEDCLVAVDLSVPAVDLATIMGIKQQKCFTHLNLKLRNCTSIKDFTENCATNGYRREFAGVNPAQAYTCSLHSLTPSCRQSCSDAACLRTPRDQVEWTFKHRESRALPEITALFLGVSNLKLVLQKPNVGLQMRRLLVSTVPGFIPRAAHCATSLAPWRQSSQVRRGRPHGPYVRTTSSTRTSQA